VAAAGEPLVPRHDLLDRLRRLPLVRRRLAGRRPLQVLPPPEDRRPSRLDRLPEDLLEVVAEGVE
jgi:hypothetical protein